MMTAIVMIITGEGDRMADTALEEAVQTMTVVVDTTVIDVVDRLSQDSLEYSRSSL